MGIFNCPKICRVPRLLELRKLSSERENVRDPQKPSAKGQVRHSLRDYPVHPRRTFRKSAGNFVFDAS